MGQTLTLTGYMGQEPRIGTTKSRTLKTTGGNRDRFRFQHGGREIQDVNDYVDSQEGEFTTAPRTFATLSIATHQWQGGSRKTTWHRVVAWNIDQLHFGLRRLGQGDKVEITGRQVTFETEDGTEISQIELLSFKLVTRKLRAHPPAARLAPQARREQPATSKRFFRTADGRSIPLTGAPRYAAAQG